MLTAFRSVSIRAAAVRPGGFPGLHTHSVRFRRRRVLFSTSTDSPISTINPPAYDHIKVESKWQARWNEWAQEKSHLSDKSKQKYYSLAMFPYPSGNLHMGHARVYTISDTASRMQRMMGKKVLHPMGWDAFGLPAENAAIERNIVPHFWTMQNIAHMKKQLLQLGTHFDWTQEIATCSPDYYKWTQWLFLRLHKRGLAYQKESYVNWDPVDQTVLANEQVDAEGKSWRSGAVVEKKLMRQWYLNLTKYAEPLLKDLDKLSGWPDKVKKMQKEWIGKTTGAHIVFRVNGATTEAIEVFTTRPDTIYGCTYVVLAPEHPLVSKLVPDSHRGPITEFCKEAMMALPGDRTDPQRPKKGIFLGVHVKHPVKDELLPVYVGDYVLADYATGAVMGVPAHDARDFQFAKQYNLPVIQVIELPEGAALPYTGQGLLVNSGRFNGMKNTEAISAIAKEAEKAGWGAQKTIYNLRDWLVSRQRYWGTPIPIIHCNSCGAVPVPEKDLPVELPIEEVNFKGKGSPLAEMASWVETKCPCCGSKARRETDTMDTFVDSAWYFLRYPDATNKNDPFDVAIAKEWMPVDVYVGGVEHAILHLLYSRFVTKFLHDEGLVPSSEPFTALKTQGMVHGKTFRLPGSERPIPPDQVEDKGAQAFLKATGQELSTSWEKMSKSKYNGVDPERVVTEYGADTVRLFLLFKAPVDQVLDWDAGQIQGQLRWIRRLWSLLHVLSSAKVAEASSKLSTDEAKLQKQLQETIRDNTKEMQDFSFNTAIARLMKLSNSMADLLYGRTGSEDASGAAPVSNCPVSPLLIESMKVLIRLLYPMAPHFASEAWQLLHAGQTVAHVSESGWPTYDAKKIVDDSSIFSVSIGGTFRGTMEIEPQLVDDEAGLVDLICSSAIGQKFVGSKKVRRVILAKSRRVVNLLLE